MLGLPEAVQIAVGTHVYLSRIDREKRLGLLARIQELLVIGPFCV